MVLEVDEGWLPWAVEVTQPRSVVLTNLSRDQLSRHHEVAAPRLGLAAGLGRRPGRRRQRRRPRRRLGRSGRAPPGLGRGRAALDRRTRWSAPRCGGPCRRTADSWACQACALRRPEPDWWLDGRRPSSGATGRVPLHLALPGDFNRGNAALALAVAQVTDARRARGRGRTRWRRCRRCRALRTGPGRRARRPADAGQEPGRLAGARSTCSPVRDHPVVLLFNAEGVDGRDPSWLYDVSFASLRGRDVGCRAVVPPTCWSGCEFDGVAAQAVAGRLAAALATAAGRSGRRDRQLHRVPLGARGAARVADGADDRPDLPRAPRDLRRPRQRAGAGPARGRPRASRRRWWTWGRSDRSPPRATSTCSAAARTRPRPWPRVP